MSIKGWIITLAAGAIGIIYGAVLHNTKNYPYSIISPIVENASDTYRNILSPESEALLNLTLEEREYAETTNEGKFVNDRTFQSRYFDKEILVPAGVFWPREAEGEMLPIMSRNRHLFEGKRVLEIGTGTGIISVYAATLGATKVVSTDISPLAIAAAKANAENQGVGDILDARLVTQDDLSAYAVIGDDEQFDVIISNPPYAIDLDAPTTTAVVDNGDLGFSIVRGFDKHLSPDGVAILFYGSGFFHEVMAKFAAFEGYNVRNHSAVGMFPWEAEALYNSYLKRLLAAEGLPPDAFKFNFEVDQALRQDFLKNTQIKASDVGAQRLLEGEKGWFWYPGMMTIKHPD